MRNSQQQKTPAAAGAFFSPAKAVTDENNRNRRSSSFSSKFDYTVNSCFCQLFLLGALAYPPGIIFDIHEHQ